MSMNMAIISGRVGQDPTVKRLDGGSVANFSVATSERWKDKRSGEMKERTQWHRIVVWGDGLVDAIEKYLRKGMVAEIVGQIETREWERDGAKHYSTEIIVKGFSHKLEWFETVKREASGREPPPNVGGANAGGFTGRGPIDDEIPFAPEFR